MELKKGYKSEELTGFFKECYRTGKRARKTADGGWTDEDAVEIPAQSNNESFPDAKGIENCDSLNTSTETCKENSDSLNTTEQTSEAPSEPGTEKKGAWKRFKSFFKKKE
jgi:hypothetical protein